MTAPGELRHRLVLEAPVETPDGAGGVTRSYAGEATVWAKVTPIGARGEVVADDTGATVTHRIVIRARSDLTTRHRLRDGTRVLRIVAFRDQDGSGRFIEISAQERVD
jgi:SPP1 family predicted phage head-tail adaptor